MNKYAIIHLHLTLEEDICLFRFKEKSIKMQSFGYPKMVDPVFLASKKDSSFKEVEWKKTNIYFSRDPEDDIIFEAETDEDALLYFEVME